MLTQAIINYEIEGTLVSTRVEGGLERSLPYKEVAKQLLDHEVNLVGVIRGENVHVRFENLDLTENDRLVYISSSPHDWQAIRLFLSL